MASSGGGGGGSGRFSNRAEACCEQDATAATERDESRLLRQGETEPAAGWENRCDGQERFERPRQIFDWCSFVFEYPWIFLVINFSAKNCEEKWLLFFRNFINVVWLLSYLWILTHCSILILRSCVAALDLNNLRRSCRIFLWLFPIPAANLARIPAVSEIQNDRNSIKSDL